MDTYGVLCSRAEAAYRAGRIDRAKQVIAQTLTVPSSTRSLNPLAKALHGEDLGSLRLVADTLFEAGQLGLAREYYQKVAEIQPTSFIFGRLGHVCRFTGALSAAAEYLRKALDLEPDHAECLANLGDTLILLGRIEEGVALTRQAVERHPDCAKVHSNYLFAMHYLPSQDRASVYEEHIRWGRRHAPVSLAKRSHDNDPDPGRPLRIGYLSADFRMHSAAYTFESLLDGVDRSGFQVFGYGSIALPDSVTQRLRSKFDMYREVSDLEALWMGVPVVSLRGQTLVSRVGLSILSRVGMSSLVAPTPQDFVERAVTLAGNTKALAKIRTSLRRRMRASPLCDATRYAREVEAAYRKMWWRWCVDPNPEARSQNPELTRQGGGG